MSAADEPSPQPAEPKPGSDRALKGAGAAGEPHGAERNASAHALEAGASPTGRARPETGAPPEYDESMVQVLASKLLSDWLRNRQQLLVPFTLDLHKLDPAEVETLMHAMIAAANAGGEFGEKARERLDAALARLNANDGQREAFRQALDEPRALPAVLATVRDVRVGAMVYAASLLAIDRRKLVNRHFMRYLAARLDLSSQLARSLEQRFRPAV